MKTLLIAFALLIAMPISLNAAPNIRLGPDGVEINPRDRDHDRGLHRGWRDRDDAPRCREIEKKTYINGRVVIERKRICDDD